MKKRILSVMLALIVSVSVMSTPAFAQQSAQSTSEQSTEITANQNSKNSYADYQSENTDKKAGDDVCYAVLPQDKISGESKDFNFQINIKTPGLYNLEVEYTCLEGGISAIERKLLINNSLLFEELEDISFERTFEDETEITQDSLGNDIIPSQIEKSISQTKRINDISGYYNRPYEFYFEAGTVSFSLIGIVGNMEITSIKAVPPEKLPTYSETEKIYEQKGYKEASKPLEIIHTENSSLKSSYTLVPTTDRSSPITKPYSVSKLKLNTIGGDSWATTGMWLEWNISVKESGLYRINFRYRQNVAKGVTVFRKLSIDGAVPFEEAAALPFVYNRSWNIDEYNDYLYYLEAGEHTLRLESVLGEMGAVLMESEDFMYSLNSLYREIITVTGTSPDIYRDYKIEKRIDRLSERLSGLADSAYALIKKINDISGGKNSVSVLLESFAEQLKQIAKEPSEITEQLSDFKNNIISLGETISEMRKTPLELDYIYISDPKSELPKANGSFWLSVKHEISAFFLSFIEDYSSFVSDSEGTTTSIGVWVSSGREQANIIKTLINSSFTSSGISVDLKLVQGGLLQAMIAGNGPDVALNLGQSDPVNYALRNAVYDLTKFSDYISVSKRFNQGALTPFTFSGGVYALPETESFYMLFYRKDVLKDLNITPPETWDELYGILPILSRNNMEFGLQSSLNTFATLLYQNGGEFYRSDATASSLNSQVGLNTFTQWTDFYTSYKLSVSFDFANRFRTGEMPMAIVDYTSYNTLTAFAPELRGYWDFCEIPGNFDPETGEINRTTVNSVSGVSILASSEHKDEAWEFLKWWVSANTQTNYATKIESVLGESSRHATANLEARQNIGWSAESLKKLNNQANWVIGIPEIAGGYYTSRNITNAFNSVINKGTVPNTTLNNYVGVINREIESKRKELGID